MKAPWMFAVTLIACGGDDGAPAIDGGGDVDGPTWVAQACAAAPGATQRVLAPFYQRVEIVDGALWLEDEVAVWRWTLGDVAPTQVAPLSPNALYSRGVHVSGDEIFDVGPDGLWRWTLGSDAWKLLRPPGQDAAINEIEGLPGGGVLVTAYCFADPPACPAGIPLYRIAPGATEFEPIVADVLVRSPWAIDGGAVFYQRAVGGNYETVRRDLSSGDERVLYTGAEWEDAHPPLAVDGDVIYAAMGDSGPSWDQTSSAIEERTVADGALLRSWPFPRTPTKFLIDDTHLYWVDPGWYDPGPMPRPPEAGGIHRVARASGSDEPIASAPGLGLKDMALTDHALYYTVGDGLWCLRK